ncbi:hypothetical protein CcaverHIS002_0112490 [Cutaneotrichosporon cavernicola]|uniref:Uncharacterized protein n=1 Tax=Cutaneotrichosporon cavernicola TaxID=279322 RepID=A0AA48KXQ3_9TREE|nr:uncharacterized protein CcaverHIS019_0112370 [Cutaneotrichosporon cavernicola]BEI80720.1 hypothetical protein CcaverHIS002_0112490 [Cutaneotrichosporon cavernicola]BEI88519.1 hypothetical protein CcaverHIS019_0112370 [Cutaneotrichosporon cavernicola]BEI96292.1 hypothetical protein CcaverHIS631_0112410 [Cutaneotrichosporon cavernicola]BEJ04064.1 hypothetical protein CcaverHIS641_0112390 [Cutaneotrichosporon cavernicola]
MAVPSRMSSAVAAISKSSSASHPTSCLPNTSLTSPIAPNTTTTTTATAATASTHPPITVPGATVVGRKLPSKLAAYAPTLARLSARTGVPLPSLLASFLVLHELTALVPLVLLFYLFSALGAGASFLNYLHDMAKKTTGEDVAGPWASMAHVAREWYDEGSARVERVGRRYGLFGFEKGSEVAGLGREAAGTVADAVAAYVVVKALMPLRVAVSVGAAPGFARIVFRPMQRLVARLRTPRMRAARVKAVEK